MDRQRLDDLRDLLAEEVARRALPAGALGVATSSGPIISSLLPGVCPLGPDPLWWLASISKAVCATAVLQLVGEGRLVLDQPVTELLPELQARPPRPITLWHLLTHTSGVPDVDWMTALETYPEQVVGFAEACRSPSTFPPGTQHAYSSLTFFLIAELVARADSLEYEQSVRRRVLVPAGAEGITLDPRAEAARMVAVQGIAADLPIPPDRATDALISARMPGGGMWGTLDDLLTLGTTLLRDARDGEARLLSRPLIRLMSTDHVRGLHRVVDSRREPASWGLGWRVGKPEGLATLPGSDQVLEHDGAGGGALWIDPAYDLVVVFLTSRLAAPGDLWRRAVQGAYGALR